MIALLAALQTAKQPVFSANQKREIQLAEFWPVWLPFASRAEPVIWEAPLYIFRLPHTLVHISVIFRSGEHGQEAGLTLLYCPSEEYQPAAL